MDEITFIGIVHSSLQQHKDCPLQENEGAPSALIQLDPAFRKAALGLKAGQKIWLLTWLHKANRSTATAKPRNNPASVTKGVFATRAPIPLACMKRRYLRSLKMGNCE